MPAWVLELRTSPSAALEALLDLLPLHLHIRREAILSASRITQTTKLKSGDLTGHLRIIKEIQLEAMTKPLDTMPKVCDFQRFFRVVIKDRQEMSVKSPQFENGSLVWYTDGSKMEKGVGAGVLIGPKYRLSKSLGETPSTF